MVKEIDNVCSCLSIFLLLAGQWPNFHNYWWFCLFQDTLLGLWSSQMMVLLCGSKVVLFFVDVVDDCAILDVGWNWYLHDCHHPVGWWYCAGAMEIVLVYLEYKLVLPIVFCLLLECYCRVVAYGFALLLSQSLCGLVSVIWVVQWVQEVWSPW